MPYLPRSLRFTQAISQHRPMKAITAAVPVSIEVPEGWGPTQLLVAELERLGYRVEKWPCWAGPCSSSPSPLTR